MPDIGLGEAAGRLVENQDAASDANAACDFDQLLLGDGEIVQGTVGINVRPSKLCHGVSGSAAHFRPAQKWAAGRLHAEENVFHDGQVAGEGKFLVDHGNAASPGLERIAGSVRNALDPHFTCIRRMRSG